MQKKGFNTTLVPVQHPTEKVQLLVVSEFQYNTCSCSTISINQYPLIDFCFNTTLVPVQHTTQLKSYKSYGGFNTTLVPVQLDNYKVSEKRMDRFNTTLVPVQRKL